MPAMSAPRKLAAILAADVAGYSLLTGLDEEGTLERLRNLRRELINPTISLHRGRVVKTTGDGILIEFPSVVVIIGRDGIAGEPRFSSLIAHCRRQQRTRGAHDGSEQNGSAITTSRSCTAHF